jgi:hypothetical protein
MVIRLAALEGTTVGQGNLVQAADRFHYSGTGADLSTGASITSVLSSVIFMPFLIQLTMPAHFVKNHSA